MEQLVQGGVLSGMPQIYAKLAAASYDRAKSADNIDSFVCDRSFGQANSSVYVNNDLKEVVYAIRGTNPKNPEDLLNDAAIMVGAITKTRRFKELSQRFADIYKKYTGYKIVLVGHSLGGELCRNILLQYPQYIDSAHVFNSGSGVGVAVKSLLCKFKMSNECKIMKNKLHVYSVPGDVVSFLSMFLPGKKIVEQSNSNNPLDLHQQTNFTGGIINMGVKELRAMCKRKKIKGFSTMKRAQLIDALNKKPCNCGCSK